LIDTSLFLSIQVDIFGYICFLQYGWVPVCITGSQFILSQEGGIQKFMLWAFTFCFPLCWLNMI
jgi:hypothetical protein